MISGLGFGGSAIGNLYREVSEADAFAAVDAAWQAGVRYFDTAPHYGLGLSERRLGAALADRPRSEFVVSTKVGRLLEPFDGGGNDLADGFAVPATHRRVWDLSAEGVRRSLEASLTRLGLDRVDIVYLHDPDDHWEEAVHEALPALAELKAQGVIRGIGVGMNQWQLPRRFIQESSVDYVMLAGRYTLLEHESLSVSVAVPGERGLGGGRRRVQLRVARTGRSILRCHLQLHCGTGSAARTCAADRRSLQAARRRTATGGVAVPVRACGSASLRRRRSVCAGSHRERDASRRGGARRPVGGTAR